MSSQESSQESSQQFPETQEASSQPSQHEEDSTIWGSLNYWSADPGDNSRFEFTDPNHTYVIGRMAMDDVVDFSFPRIVIMSRMQCSFKAINYGLSTFAIEITDLGSRNGTWVNNRMLSRNQSVVMRHDCVISFGQWTTKPHPRFELRLHRDNDYLESSVSELPSYSETYVLLGDLGAGGFGSVKKAMHSQEKKVYAIKFIKEDQTSTHIVDQSPSTRRENRRKHLNDEIDILQRLRHPHIVEFKEALSDDRGLTLGIVVEFMPGGDLDQYIRRSRSRHIYASGLPEKAAKHFMKQICDALVYMHRENIIHRDLKPSNILLSNTVPPIAKIADFNLARLVGPEALLSKACGTHKYMAPEILNRRASEHVYERAVDSWSLGVTLSMMIWYRDPFKQNGSRLPELDMSPLLSDDISFEGQQVIVGLLQNDPKARMTPAAVLSHAWMTTHWSPETSYEDNSHGLTWSFAQWPPRGTTSGPIVEDEGADMYEYSQSTVRQEQSWDDNQDFLTAQMSIASER